MSNSDDCLLSKNNEVGQTVKRCAREKVTLVIIPRLKKNIFKAGKRVKDMLEKSLSVAGSSPIREFEKNFYPDLNKKRTLTVIVTEDAWNPLSDVCPAIKDDTVKLELIEGDVSDFGLSTSSAATSGGFLEFQLEVKNLYKEKELPSHQKVKIKATVKDKTAEIALTVHRNEDVNRDFDNVLNRSTILVAQASDWVTSDGVRHLQELLHQVVARHKASNAFEWLTLDGQYGNSCKTDTKEFINHFKGAYDYKKGSFNVAVDQVLIDYVKAEYGSYTDGCLVDCKLLTGEAAWVAGQSQSQADGLLDIYKAVVERFFSEMQRMATAYTTGFPTFWLHRPSESPYQQGDEINTHYIVTPDSLNIRNAADGTTVLEKVTKGVTLAYGNEKQTVAGKDWFKVTTPSGNEGWCVSWHLEKICDDRAKSIGNHGNYGDNGVAYSYGGKDLPAAFQQHLEDNNPLPNDIKSWKQYAEAYAPKKGRPGDDTGPGNGCDCAGFTQNCITESKFPDGSRIVSDNIIKQIEPVPEVSWPWTNCILASSFVGAYSRKIPYHAYKEKKQWIDQADVITSPSHVVWVADPSPTTKDPSNDQDFEVYNEYGSDYWWDTINNVTDEFIPENKFIRKAIRMKFRHWGIKLNQGNKNVGRIFFWS